MSHLGKYDSLCLQSNTFSLQLRAAKQVELLEARAVENRQEAEQVVAVRGCQSCQVRALQLQGVQLSTVIHCQSLQVWG